jgi:hypothetical protein
LVENPQLPQDAGQQNIKFCVSVFLSSLSGVQDAPFLRSAVARMTVPYISTSSHKQHDFREKSMGYKMCFMILSTNFV